MGLKKRIRTLERSINLAMFYENLLIHCRPKMKSFCKLLSKVVTEPMEH